MRPDFGYHSGMSSNHISPNERRVAAAVAAGAPELPPPTRVLRQFRIVFNAVKSHFRNVEKAAGIGGSQLWALSVIQQSPGIGVGDLARALDVHQTTASNLVKGLAAQGLIEQGKSDADRRAVTMSLSAAGQALLEKAPMPFAGVLPDALASMDAATLARMEQDLSRLILALEAGNAGANTPLADL
jgi:DNA-binding MarR family transcriptional regulator